MSKSRTRSSLDELTPPTPSLPFPSISSLSYVANIASSTLGSGLESGSKPKQTVNPSTVRLVHSEAPHNVNRTEKDSAPTSSGSLLVPPRPASVQSSLIGNHSVDNLGRKECYSLTDHSSLNMLRLHPFSQASACNVDSGCLVSSHLVKPSGSVASSSTFPDPPRPPSSASFIDMGKNPQGKRGHSYQVQGFGRRWGQSVSDGIPLIAYNARKGGKRFWRTLIRPSVLSFLDNSKPDASSIPPASAELKGPDAFEELPPRPAPYFYPRRVDPHKDAISCESMHESFFCNLGELPADSSTGVAIDQSKPVTKSRKASELKRPYGGGGKEEGVSVDSDEIETWRQQQTDLATKKSRPSLRQRFGSSLRQSIGFQQLRSAFSELDLSQFARQQDVSETLGPGITDDPFASLSTSPQLVPTQVTLRPATSSLSLSAAAALPLLSSSELVLDFTNPTSDAKRRSFINMDADCDDPSTSSSVSRSDTSHQQPSPSPLYANLGCLSALERSMHHDKGITPTSILYPQSGHVTEDSGVLCQTPVLTPDLESIEDASPLLSESFCAAVELTSLKHGQDLGKIDTSIVPFPCLHSCQERSLPDIYEESAVEEGTSQDQNFHSCVLGLSPPRSVSLKSVSSNSPRSRRKFSLRGVGGECLADVSVASIDMGESMTDFTLLAVEWPQPPREPSPEPGTTSGDKPDLELAADPLHAHEGEHPLPPPASDMPPLDKYQTCITPVARETSAICLSTVDLSSAVDLVEVTLGSSTLKHTALPNIIVLAPTTETQPTGTSISFRAASRPVLISFLVFHAETRLEAQSVSREGASILAGVALCRAADDNQVNPDKMTVTLMKDGKESPLKLAAKDRSLVNFSVGLPITLGELAVAIAKISFGKSMVLDGK